MDLSVDCKREIKIADKYLRLRDSAISRGIEFDLTLKRVRQLLSRKTCFYTGVRFDMTNPHGPNFPTVDRIDAARGYVDDNVVMCINSVNNAKTNLTLTQMKKVFYKLQSVGKL